jgi:hypothetical protein
LEVKLKTQVIEYRLIGACNLSKNLRVDKEIVSGILHDLKPFKFTPGRKFDGFRHLGDTVFAGIDGNK